LEVISGVIVTSMLDVLFLIFLVNEQSSKKSFEIAERINEDRHIEDIEFYQAFSGSIQDKEYELNSRILLLVRSISYR
jgi:hypothetical protein